MFFVKTSKQLFRQTLCRRHIIHRLKKTNIHDTKIRPKIHHSIISQPFQSSPLFPHFILTENYNMVKYHPYSTQNISKHKDDHYDEDKNNLTTSTKNEKESKLKILYNKYGRVAIGTYLSVYVGTLFSIYGLFDSGILIPSDLPFDLDVNEDGKVDMRDVGSMYGIVISYFKLDDYIDPSTFTPSQGNFMLAWITTKLVEPLRALATIILTPPIARRLNPEKFIKDDQKSTTEQ